MKYILSSLTLLLIIGACTTMESKSISKENLENAQVVTFAGGCFWCMEAAFQEEPGVIEVISGYSNGDVENPTYEQVSSGQTKHLEAVQVYYDPAKITYEKILEVYWLQIDPTDDSGQFADKGSQYKTAIFYKSEEEKDAAEKSKENIAKMFDKPIVTAILPLKNFYPAEEYHQDYYLKRTTQYRTYKKLSGREEFIHENEERMNANLKEKLTPLQYQVTQEEATEPPFKNEYWDNKQEGIYVDIVSGEPLFSSNDKFDSGTGWPSFTKPLEPANIVQKEDRKIIFKRTEIRSKQADSHLGHLFMDGPAPTGARYCMNSAALKFIPKEKLKEEGYEEYLQEFNS